MLEKLGFRQPMEETLTVKRQTRAMHMHRFVLAMVLACYVGFSRLYLKCAQFDPSVTRHPFPANTHGVTRPEPVSLAQSADSEDSGGCPMAEVAV
jgi:hypothetical protein